MSARSTPQIQARSDRGSALFVALISLVVVSALVATMMFAVDRERVGVVLDADRLQAARLADGALEVAEDAFLRHLANFKPLPDPPAGAPFQVLDDTYAAGPHSAHWTISRATALNGSGNPVPIPPRSEVHPVTGLVRNIESYVVETSLSVGTSKLRMRRFVDIAQTPIFQFLAYYTGDLEIQPGPPMTLNGRIHTNADLYMAAAASLSITSKYVKTAQDFFRRRKHSSDPAPGWIKIQDAATNGLVTLPSQSDLAALGISSANGLDSDFTGWEIDGDGLFVTPGEMSPFKNEAASLFGGTLETGEHGVRALQAPDVAAIQPYVADAGGDYIQIGNGTFQAVPPGTGTHAKSYFHEGADLVITDNQVFNHQGVNITGSMPSGFVTTRTLWDQREGRDVTCTEINLARLGDMDGDPETYDPCPHYPANGLIYATRSNAAGGSAGGVVLSNGSELNIPAKWNIANYDGQPPTGIGPTLATPIPGPPPPAARTFGNADITGLTVVTPQPAYVHGDYNTVSKKPASVITDTVNLLSNAWDHSKAQGQSVTASDTTYNLAMIAGHSATAGSQYGGGFENLTRFHEDWTNKTCAINGSFVSPWQSLVATAPWVSGGAWYEPPVRNWNFEAMFDQGKLPPFTPMVVTSERVAWEVTN